MKLLEAAEDARLRERETNEMVSLSLIRDNITIYRALKVFKGHCSKNGCCKLVNIVRHGLSPILNSWERRTLFGKAAIRYMEICRNKLLT